MGAVSGSATYQRFFVDGKPPKDMTQVFEQAIEARRFVPLERGGKEAMGWVPLDTPYDDENPITRDRFYFGHIIGLGYREDKVSVPKGLVVHQTKLRLDKMHKEGKKITRQTRQAMRLAVADELAKKTLPKTRIMDILWDVTKDEVRIFGRGPMANERATALFERTFSARLSEASWAGRAFAMEHSARARKVLESLEPEALFDEPTYHGDYDDE